MTAIGHFSILSETVDNPSICTFVMTLSNNKSNGGATPLAGGADAGSGDKIASGNTNDAFSARDFVSLWKERNMATLHPRFHLRASATHPGHFESTTTTTNTTSSSSRTSSFAADNDTGDEDPVELHVSEGLPLRQESHHLRRADILHRVRQMQTQPWSLHEKLWHVDVIPPALPALWSLGPSSAAASKHEKVESSNTTTILFRGHHVLADGASIGAALMDLSDEAQEFRRQIVSFVEQRRRQQAQRLVTFWQRLLQRFKIWIWLCRGTLQALLYQTKLVWYNAFCNPADPWGMVKKAAQLEQKSKKKAGDDAFFSFNRILDPTSSMGNGATDTVAADLRSVSYTTMAPLDQAKWIAETLSKLFNHDNGNSTSNKKRTESKITINDLFVTAITAAIVRQLQEHRQRLNVISSYHEDHNGVEREKVTKAKIFNIPRQDRILVSVPVHLSGGIVLPGASIGNNIGAFTVQLPGEESTATPAATSTTPPPPPQPPAVQRLFAVHQELLKVKQTPAPLLSNMIARMSVAVLPRTWVSYLFQKASAGSTCVITNVRGPSSQHMHMKGRTVESLYGFVPLPPGIPIGVVVSSYAGQMLLTVTAESWAVPNADLFLSWVVDEYLILLKEASRAAGKEERRQSKSS
jgi:WS/DGAT C-terminal domain